MTVRLPVLSPSRPWWRPMALRSMALSAIAVSAVVALSSITPPAVAQILNQTESESRMAAARAELPKDAARVLFGDQKAPASLQARAIGSYARGCLAGAVALPVNGPAWQVMRLSRNRMWGHPDLITFLERFATTAREKDGWNGLLVGDISQPRGGPMLTGHNSHQIGLDADIWFTPMPNRTLTTNERESISAINMLKDGTREANLSVLTDRHIRVVRRASLDPLVERIFVHPGIKKAMCDWQDKVGGDRTWLNKVRPIYGHNYHFHIRIGCPAGMAGCKPQDKIPGNDGCGEEIAWWLGPEPWKPSPPGKPKPPLKLADLPPECSQVLVSN
jgi:penicillin-insensitive murein DD-endopeptidase